MTEKKIISTIKKVREVLDIEWIDFVMWFPWDIKEKNKTVIDWLIKDWVIDTKWNIIYVVKPEDTNNTVHRFASF